MRQDKQEGGLEQREAARRPFGTITAATSLLRLAALGSEVSPLEGVQLKRGTCAFSHTEWHLRADITRLCVCQKGKLITDDDLCLTKQSRACCALCHTHAHTPVSRRRPTHTVHLLAPNTPNVLRETVTYARALMPLRTVCTARASFYFSSAAGDAGRSTGVAGKCVKRKCSNSSFTCR